MDIHLQNQLVRFIELNYLHLNLFSVKECWIINNREIKIYIKFKAINNQTRTN